LLNSARPKQLVDGVRASVAGDTLLAPEIACAARSRWTRRWCRSGAAPTASTPWRSSRALARGRSPADKVVRALPFFIVRASLDCAKAGFNDVKRRASELA
jgi:hypothetical protein